jgi:streptogramin lyase
VKRLNPASDRPIPVEPAGFPTDVAADDEAAWLALPDRGAIQRMTGDGGAERPIELDDFPFGIAVGEGGIWTLSERMIERVDPASGESDGPATKVPGASAIAAGESAVWVLRRGSIVRLDPGTGEVDGEPIPAPGAVDVAAGLGYVWVASGDGTLTRLDSGTGAQVGEPVSLDARPRAIAAGEGAVWIAATDGDVHRVDP